MTIIKQDMQGSIALLTIDYAPVNALAQTMRQELLIAIKGAISDPSIEGLVLTGAGSCFIAGADISELDHSPSEPQLPYLTSVIEQSPKPIVVALNGVTLGGGLEVALAAHGRIAVPKAKLGFPEVNLGIIPGSGGTVRVSRLVGFDDAVTLLTSGKPVSAQSALSMGLIDQMTEDGIQAALELAMQLCSEGHQKTLDREIVLAASEAEWQSVMAGFQQENSQAQLAAIQSLHIGCQQPVDIALHRERASFLRLKETAQSRALRHLFFAERSVGSEIPNSAEKIQKIGIVGAGTMGCGLAVSALMAGYFVRLIDHEPAQLSVAEAKVTQILDQSVSRGIITIEKQHKLLQNMSIDTQLSKLWDSELVIEAVFEDYDIKSQILTEIENYITDQCLLCSNSSYLDLNGLAEGLKLPHRFLGMHFFAPAYINKLVELIPTTKTDMTMVSKAKTVAKSMRKLVVLAQVCDGFIGNRIMAQYRTECDFLLEEGASPQAIDKAMIEFGFKMGNYAIADMSGLEIAWAMRKRRTVGRDPSERYSKIADILCAKGWFGRKSGRGWYDYRSDSKGTICPEVQKVIENESLSLTIQRREFTSSEIMQRILDRMVEEAEKILAEGIAQKASDIDLVMVTGFGFPRHKGGPLQYKNSLKVT